MLETSTVGNTTQVAQIMEACTDMGVKFSLDDFGTGYSSLTYFHRLPISILKIDRDFVRDMLENPQDQDIVEGILRLAEALKRPVVAEGVESIELGLMLLQLGCQYAQGYGIARPMPPEVLIGWSNKFRNKSPWSQLTKDIQEMKGPYELNVAIFTHRKWLEKIKAYIQSGLSKKRPHLDGDSCQFSCWYKGIGAFRYGEHPLYLQVETVHGSLHHLAEEIIQLAENDHLDQALSQLDELDIQSEKLISLLCALTDNPI